MKSKWTSSLTMAMAAVASTAVLSGCAGSTTSSTAAPSSPSPTTTVQRDAAWGYKSSNVCIYNHNSEPIHVKWEKYDSVTTAPDLEVAPSGKTCAEGQNVGQTFMYKALDSKKAWSYDVSGTITERGSPVSFTAENVKLMSPAMVFWKDLDYSTLNDPGNDRGWDVNLDNLRLNEDSTAFANGVPYMAVEVTRLPDTDWKEWKLELG